MIRSCPLLRILPCLLIAAATGAEAQIVIGGPVNRLEDLKPILRTAPQKADLTQLQESLHAAGDLTLSRTTLILDAEDQRQTFHLTARRLRLEGSTIITNGHNLVIHAEQIASDSASQVLAIAEEAPGKPAPGSQGGKLPDGRAGRSAGRLDLFMLKEVDGMLVLDFEGQDGKVGADGVNGADGVRGAKGRSSKVKWGACKRGAKRGGNGGDGIPGGNGGNGGNGGDGGVIEVSFYNAPVNVTRIVYDVDAGAAGQGGAPGAGGRGGPGGSRGSNHSPCSWSSPDPGDGSRGRDGAAGLAGVAGKTGAAGRFRAQRLDLPNGGQQ